MDKNKIRNFSIIAHIDHGKSTLADRILEFTNAVDKRTLTSQHLDSMDLERERGITIKLNAVQIHYKDFIFHLIDTPGHVDFSYEVSRSLAATEGALLLVDATQGIQAQTLANVYLAIDRNITIIPIINKIDLPSADPQAIIEDIENQIPISAKDAILISAKTGKNIEEVIDAIIKRIPAPVGEDSNDTPLQALVFDSYFDSFRGVVLLIRIFNGRINVNDQFMFMDSKKTFFVTELGVRRPEEVKLKTLYAGEVGWIAASIRDAKDVSVGDTITLVKNAATQSLIGYKKMRPVVYSGFYPIDGKKYPILKDALLKIALSDSSIKYLPETSKALGFGFRIGFLGMLHMEILQERLEREFNVELIATAPSVEFKVTLTNSKTLIISNPSDFPDPSFIDYIEEPMIKASIVIPEIYIGKVMQLCEDKRGIYIDLKYLDNVRRKVIYNLPMVEIVFDFFDKLKSITKGYATFDYDMIGYFKSPLIKMDILIAGEKVDALSVITHKNFAQTRGKNLVKKLKEVVPRQNFEVAIQAAIGAKIISRETIKAYRKDVTAKLYGGDPTRRQKLLKKQKRGKKRMKLIGKVSLPQEAFLAILSNDSN